MMQRAAICLVVFASTSAAASCLSGDCVCLDPAASRHTVLDTTVTRIEGPRVTLAVLSAHSRGDAAVAPTVLNMPRLQSDRVGGRSVVYLSSSQDPQARIPVTDAGTIVCPWSEPPNFEVNADEVIRIAHTSGCGAGMAALGFVEQRCNDMLLDESGRWPRRPPPLLGDTNAKAIKLFKAKSYCAAARQLDAALENEGQPALSSPQEEAERNRGLALAHQYLARTLVRLRKAAPGCERDHARSEIVGHLRRAVELAPPMLGSVVADGELAIVHDTRGYQTLLGLSPLREPDLPRLLARVHWWSSGGYVERYRFTFEPAGRVVFTEEGLRPIKGRWKLSGRKLTIVFDTAVGFGHEHTGEFKESGVLTIDSWPGLELSDEAPYGD